MQSNVSCKLPISVTIIAFNEADRIEYCLQSVCEFADEILLVDSGSDDATIEIAQKYGAQVLHNDWVGYGQQKIFAQNNAKHDWILNLDADEALTDEIIKQIKQVFTNKTPDPMFAYSMDFHHLPPHAKKMPKFPFGTAYIRLYNRKFSGFRDSTVHDAVVLGENVQKQHFKGFVLHRSVRDLTHMVEKLNSYSLAQAKDIYKKGRRISPIRLVFEPIGAFIKAYFFRNYIFQGLDGFVYSCVYSFSRFIRLAKAREQYRVNDK
jgi:glycosyltransferase involved in cell wall biosynthesis